LRPEIWFKEERRNLYSIAALLPLVKGARLADRPMPGIMLYSMATAQAPEVYEEVDRAREKAICIAGGPHPSARPDEALQHFDYVVIGEGEETLPDLIETIVRGDDPGTVAGIAYKKDGITKYTCQREHVDLDKYPPFERHLLAPAEISRGCPWGCAYCQTPRLFGTRMRHRSVPVIVKYARHYSEIRFISPNSLAYGSDGVHPKLDKVELLLKSLSDLEKPIYFGTFPSEVRPEFITSDALELISRYCANDILSIGGQSGSLRMLKAIGRGHGPEEITRACELCLDYGLKPSVDLIFGLPKEELEDQLQTIELAKWIITKGGILRAHHFEPLPGTPLENSFPSPLIREAERELGKMVLEGKLRGRWWPRCRTA
jgi:B12-binding domain/radical SAM domain protein